MTQQKLLTPYLLDRLIWHGTAFAPQALDLSQLEALQSDASRISWQLQNHDGDPWLQYEDAKITPEQDFPAINALRDQWEEAVRRLTYRCTSLWDYRANDVTAQRYRTADDGIETHQDYSVDRLLIAIFTVRGSGPLEIMSARHHGTVVKRFDTRPGSLNLLWAPDLTASTTDRRPSHRILRPEPGRVSITYRYAIAKARFHNEKRNAQ